MSAYEIIARPKRDQLGETPFWDGESERLYWCDIVGRQVNRLDPSNGRIEVWDMPQVASGVVPTGGETALVMLGDGVYRLDLATGGTEVFTQPETDPRNRSNEVRTDPQGRLWLGTMANNIGPNGEDLPVDRVGGSVFCIDAHGYARRVLRDIGITNVFCWSPDGTRFDTADTQKGVIWSFDYDPDGPILSNRQVFVDKGAAAGNPDGASMDEDGCLWGARWGGAQVARFTPQGKVDRVIDLPVKQPSSCAFGGRDRRTLYITSARQGQHDLAPDALDGSLFAVQVGVAGLPMPRFASGAPAGPAPPE